MKLAARIVGTTLLLAPVSAAADVLTCEGTTFITGEASPTTFTVSLASNGAFKATTWKGEASGVLISDEDSYGGVIFSGDGTRFDVSLNRYTGELVITNFAQSKVDHMGTCMKRAARF